MLAFFSYLRYTAKCLSHFPTFSLPPPRFQALHGRRWCAIHARVSHRLRCVCSYLRHMLLRARCIYNIFVVKYVGKREHVHFPFTHNHLQSPIHLQSPTHSITYTFTSPTPNLSPHQSAPPTPPTHPSPCSPPLTCTSNTSNSTPGTPYPFPCPSATPSKVCFRCPPACMYARCLCLHVRARTATICLYHAIML